MSEENKHFDIRTVARYVARGAITDKDLEKQLKSLPDVADKGEPTPTELIQTPRENAGQ
jgi:hypothetical protein